MKRNSQTDQLYSVLYIVYMHSDINVNPYFSTIPTLLHYVTTETLAFLPFCDKDCNIL